MASLVHNLGAVARLEAAEAPVVRDPPSISVRSFVAWLRASAHRAASSAWHRERVPEGALEVGPTSTLIEQGCEQRHLQRHPATIAWAATSPSLGSAPPAHDSSFA